MSPSSSSPLPGLAPPAAGADQVRIVVAGHVDHGKSTLVGRLLADLGALPDGQLAAVRAYCERTGRPFEYAFLLDALKEERAQGVTIETARVHFRHAERRYLLLDAPGHPEFLRNMITGASRADAALLVIDAARGVEANTRRHAHLLGVLGIRDVLVVVNKMDLVGFDRDRFERVARDAGTVLEAAGVRVAAAIPVSAVHGDGIIDRSSRLSWYAGPALIGLLAGLRSAPSAADGPLRLPVQGVYRFGRRGDDRRIVAGTVESGRFHAGEELTFFPSGKRSVVESLEGFPAPPASCSAGQATGFTLREPLYLTRGEVATRTGERPPAVATRFRATLVWLGARPITPGREYLLRLGTARAPMQVERIHSCFDPTSLLRIEEPPSVERHAIAECTIRLRRAIALDSSAEVPALGRFAIVEDFEIRGGGIVLEALPDSQRAVREQALRRNAAWEISLVSPDRRADRYRHRPALLLVSGAADTDRKGLGKALEALLFDEGCAAYFVGMGNLLRGVDADLGRTPDDRTEHMRRLGEVANLLLDAGHIVIATAADLGAPDLEVITAALPGRALLSAWVGPAPQGVPCDLVLDPGEEQPVLVGRLRDLLTLEGVLAPRDRLSFGKRRLETGVIWFTGLPAAGKTTLADWVADALRQRGEEVERLDGDDVRRVFPDTGFSRADRDAQARRVGFVAGRLADHGIWAVVSLISPYRESREAVRGMARSFFEIHVATPLEVCEQRDPKGLYARARRGELPQFTGVSDPYEAPLTPDLVVDLGKQTVPEAGDRVLEAVLRRSRRSGS